MRLEGRIPQQEYMLYVFQFSCRNPSLPEAWCNCFLQSGGKYEHKEPSPASNGRPLGCPSCVHLRHKTTHIYMQQYRKEFVRLGSPRNGTRSKKKNQGRLDAVIDRMELLNLM